MENGRVLYTTNVLGGAFRLLFAIATVVLIKHAPRCPPKQIPSSSKTHPSHQRKSFPHPFEFKMQSNVSGSQLCSTTTSWMRESWIRMDFSLVVTDVGSSVGSDNTQEDFSFNTLVVLEYTLFTARVEP